MEENVFLDMGWFAGPWIDLSCLSTLGLAMLTVIHGRDITGDFEKQCAALISSKNLTSARLVSYIRARTGVEMTTLRKAWSLIEDVGKQIEEASKMASSLVVDAMQEQLNILITATDAGPEETQAALADVYETAVESIKALGHMSKRSCKDNDQALVDLASQFCKVLFKVLNMMICQTGAKLFEELIVDGVYTGDTAENADDPEHLVWLESLAVVTVEEKL